MAEEKDQEKPVYEKSTAQLDAERRAEERKRAEESDEPTVVEYRSAVNPDYGVEDEDGYIGADPEYRTAADERQAPVKDDEDWQRALMVEPAEDAGQTTLPFVPGARAGGPAVQVRREEAPADTTAKGTENQTTTRTTTVPAKSTTSTKSSK